jgi:hypothetical protein
MDPGNSSHASALSSEATQLLFFISNLYQRKLKYREEVTLPGHTASVRRGENCS